MWTRRYFLITKRLNCLTVELFFRINDLFGWFRTVKLVAFLDKFSRNLKKKANFCLFLTRASTRRHHSCSKQALFWILLHQFYQKHQLFLFDLPNSTRNYNFRILFWLDSILLFYPPRIQTIQEAFIIPLYWDNPFKLLHFFIFKKQLKKKNKKKNKQKLFHNSSSKQAKFH